MANTINLAALTKHVYYLTVFEGQETGHGLSGTLLRVSQAINKGHLKCFHQRFNQGRIHFQAQVFSRGINFLATVRFMAACFFKANNGERV